jgi:hypothetical protein
MTHSVTAVSNAATAPESVTARAARTTGTSFAEAHAAAVNASTGSDTTTTGSDSSGSSSSPASSSSSSSDAPKGERTQKVTGHQYVEIVSGPRNGMFINNAGGKRDGEAFLIVKRHGREFHVYGTGADRAVYEVGRKREDTAASGSTGTNGTADTTATSGASTTGTTGTAGTQTTAATTG